MVNSVTKTVSFRLTTYEVAAVKQRCGELSIGDYARRLVLETEAASDADIRRSMGKALLAIHLILSADSTETSKQKALDTIELAMLELTAGSGGKQSR